MSKFFVFLKQQLENFKEKYLKVQVSKNSRIYFWKTKKNQEILKIQIPKTLFLGFFCVLIWKMHQKIKEMDDGQLTQYTSKSHRMEKVEQDNKSFEKLLELDEKISSLNDEGIAKNNKIIEEMQNDFQGKPTKIQESTPSRKGSSISNTSNKIFMNNETIDIQEQKIKAISDFEEWVQKERQKNLFEKKSI